MASTLRQRIRLFGWPARGVARPWLVAATVAAMVAVAPLASAQVLYGTITGNVIDGTGAALPGTTVVAVNAGTGVSRTAATDERGTFNFSDLIPGVYDVTFELTGFKTLAQRGLRVDTNTVRRVDAQARSLELSPRRSKSSRVRPSCRPIAPT